MNPCDELAAAYNEHRLWNTMPKPEDPERCWEWSGKSKRGQYGGIYAEGKLFTVHRWAYRQFIGTIPPRLVVRHLCHNTRCCRPSHLAIGTQRDNLLDCVRSGRHPTAMSPDRVRKIFTDPEPDIAKVAKNYGVSRTAVWDIRHGRSWSHITGINHPTRGLDNRIFW